MMLSYLRLTLALVFGAWWFPTPAISQYVLQGQVRDSLTRKPMELASVFLANTTLGASADAQGQFELRGVAPGSYTLVVSYVGYQLYKRTIFVGPTPLPPLALNLQPVANQLAEVVVRPHRNRPADYQRFTQQFLGKSSFSKQCTIQNPDAAIIEYDAPTEVLTAFTPKQLQVDNWALGYRVTFHELQFRADAKEHTLYTNSEVSFQDLTPRNERQRRRWEENRQRAYYGSFPHFLRSVHQRQVAEEGFRVQRFERVVNERRARADTFMLHRSTLGMPNRAVPLSVLRHLREPAIIPQLGTKPLPLDSLGRWQSTRAWLRFRALLAVTYEREETDAAYQRLFPLAPKGHAKTQRSVVHLRTSEVEITAQGVPLSSWEVATEGYWGFERVGELLPQNYAPPLPQKP